MTDRYEWVIVGGGIHGMTVFNALREKGIDRKMIRIIDRHEQPLMNWRKQTERIGMPYLRSTRVHHTSTNPTSLRHHAEEQDYTHQAFKDTYGRPSLELFNDHALQLAQQNEVESSWIQGEVVRLRRESETWIVSTDESELRANRVVLALGQSEHHVMPEWAKSARHVFLSKHDTPPVVIIGGGISALHHTIQCAEHYPGQVTLLSRRPLEKSAFDADRKFMGPKGLTPFKSLSASEKRALIVQERRPGTATQDLIQRVRHLIREGIISHVIGEVEQEVGSGVKLTDGRIITAESIICATGIRPMVVEGSWLEAVQQALKLALSPCRTPLLNEETFEWGENLFATGSLADLTVGPFARSIYGGQAAARAIASTIEEEQTSLASV